jgi:type 1 glutamine amidotransferase
MGNKILVISKGFVHPSLFCRYHFKQLLLSLDNGFSFTFTDKLRAIENLKEKNFQGVILYYHEEKHCDHLLNRFKEFVAHGGGVLAIHSAMASFKENKEYQDILGGRFLERNASRNSDCGHRSTRLAACTPLTSHNLHYKLPVHFRGNTMI